MAEAMGTEFIDLKIDTERHANGEAVAERLTGGESKGFPWSVILDGDGKALVNSDRPGGGNIGCPVTVEECDWFVEMLRQSRQRMSDEALGVVRAELEEHAKALGRR